MILVLLGTQNNDFRRLLEKVEQNIENGIIQDEVMVQAGFTKFTSHKMEIFQMIPQEKLEKLIEQADLIITHGGVGSIIMSIKKGKKIIAVPRLKKYGEHVNNHQKEIIQVLHKKELLIGLNDVCELKQAIIRN